GRIDWGRRIPIFLFLKRIPMRPHNGLLTALPAALALCAGPAFAQRSAAEQKIDSLVARMTLEEKLGQLNQLSVDQQPTPEQLAAREAAAAGVHWTFAPMVDIARDPRWGRIAEGSGEDPYLGSAMAAARVRGFQGADPRSPDAVLATVKHFAAYGGAEGGRD